MQATARIVVNTAAQYIKTIVNILLSMYSVRLVLGLLGDADYGIYSLVAGVVSLLSFVSTSLVISTQRFLSYYQGVGDLEKSKSIFSDSVRLHFYIGLALVIVLLPFVFFLFNGVLDVPVGRISAAQFVYVTVLAVLFITFFTAPFRASLISHEDIVYISIVDVLDGVLKLVLVIVLAHLSVDKLKGYAVALLLIQIFNFLALSIYALIRYPECSIPRCGRLSSEYVRELSSFAGWTIYSTGCVIGRTQGCAIIFNKFMGVVANSAFGIALQVTGYIHFISESLLNAIRPQIIKAEGEGKRRQMLSLSCKACKLSFILLSAVVVPICFYIEPLLALWLGSDPIPDGTQFFCRMVMLASLVDSFSLGLASANQATGNIRDFSIAVNTTKLLTLPLIIVCLLARFPLVSVAICYICVELASALIRIPMVQRSTGLSIRSYIMEVIKPSLLPVVLYALLAWLVSRVLSLGVIPGCIAAFAVYSVMVYILALDGSERDYVKSYVGRLVRK